MMRKFGPVLAVLMIINSAQVKAQSESISVVRFSTKGDAISFSVENIVSVEVELAGDSSILFLSLDRGASQDLALLTSRSLGSEMSFSVCDEEITRPTINAPVTSGLVQVTLTEAEVLTMSKVLYGQINCSEYLR